MKKMRLDVGALQVDTFTIPDAERGSRGTVHAHVSMLQCTKRCDTVRTCNPADSCANEFTCAITCTSVGGG